MSELRTIDLASNSDARAAAIASYMGRCVLILQRAFQKNTDVQQAFGTWLEKEIHDTKSLDVLLHDSPLYTVSRYLGVLHSNMDATVIKRAAKLAKEQRW